ncbi:ATP-binding protein [Brevibacillus gelatini]
MIAIEDDGRGIDFDKLKQQAIEQGWRPESSDEEESGFLFYGQVSIKEEADIYSGRGLGLPIVKHELEKLQGTVSVVSRTGQGSRFLFRIPLEDRLLQPI